MQWCIVWWVVLMWTLLEGCGGGYDVVSDEYAEFVTVAVIVVAVVIVAAVIVVVVAVGDLTLLVIHCRHPSIVFVHDEVWKSEAKIDQV